MRIADCIRVAAEVWGVDKAALRTPGRTRDIAFPRHAAMLLARRQGYTLKQIANFMGGMDKTSIRYGARAAAQRVVKDDEYRANYLAAQQQIEGVTP